MNRKARAWRYNWATLPLGVVNTEMWIARLEVGRRVEFALEEIVMKRKSDSRNKLVGIFI
jgi:hypothetical protein